MGVLKDRGNVEQEATLIQAALNGDRTRTDHPSVPSSAEELAHDAAACVAVGAGAVHLHPRDSDGRESLRAEVVDEVVGVVREACGVPVGVTTGDWIEPDLDRRVAMVGAWRLPDYASVNISETGSEQIMEALLDAGVGIEAGVWSVEDARRLAASGLGGRVLRVLVEPVAAGTGSAIATVAEIHAELDRHGLDAPRLQHGDGEATWILIRDAIGRGLDTRVGLEDTLLDEDGGPTAGNAALVAGADRLRTDGPATG